MTYQAKAAVFSEIRTKDSTQSEHRVEFFNVKLGGTVRKETARHLKFKLGVISRLFVASFTKYPTVLGYLRQC